MSAPHPSVRARDLHARIVDAHAACLRSERELARLLAALADDRLYLDLGYVSVGAYAQEVLDLPPRQTRALVQIGRALPGLPALDAAMASGELGWTKAREVLRVVTPDTEAAWVNAAKAASSRELERLVSASAMGEVPPTEAKGPARQRLVFELDAQDADLVRAAIAMVRAAAGLDADDVSDGAVLADLARRALHDAKPEHAPSAERYRTVLVHCTRCGDTSGVSADADSTHVGHAACDGEVQEARPGHQSGRLSRIIPTATRRAVLHRDGWRCAVPGCCNDLWIDVHHIRERHRGGDHRASNLVTLCCAHHRLVHDGRMAVRVVEHGLEFELDGGRVLTSWLRRDVGRAPSRQIGTAERPAVRPRISWTTSAGSSHLGSRDR